MTQTCTAQSRKGARCRRSAIEGGTVCRYHGGKAPQVQAAAATRVAESKVLELLKDFDVQPVEDPLTELKLLAGQALAWRDLCAGQVAKLTSFRYDALGGEQLRAEVALWERALDRCATILTAIAKLNLDQRLAVISERQADAVVRAVDAALAAAGLDGEPAQRARAVAARELRVVS